MNRISQSHYWDIKRLWEEYVKVKNDDFFYRIGWVHIYTPNQFTVYLAGREIVDGEIVVKDVIFENTMVGFIVPSGVTKMSFSNSIAPQNMANFFESKSIDILDLTGLDMSGVISLNSTFESTSGSEIKLTPIAYPLGILTTEFAFSESNVTSVEIGQIIKRTLNNARYMFASSKIETINFDDSYNSFPVNLDMTFMFYNMSRITSIDFKNLRIWPMSLAGTFQSSNSLNELKLYGLYGYSEKGVALYGGIFSMYCLNALNTFTTHSGLKISIYPDLVEVDTIEKTFKIKCAYDSNSTIYSYSEYNSSTYTFTI